MTAYIDSFTRTKAVDFASGFGMQDGVRTYAQALLEDGPRSTQTSKQQHEERNANAHRQAQARKGAKAHDYLKSLLG